ncbi:MAG: hypothetical protein HYV35_10640 [Lentisphaerae bacterium]|nr:hypothetical protein [Lentisphaerota bacterium]
MILNGVWEFCYDPDDRGKKVRWFAPDFSLPERIRVPGCSQVRAYRSAGSRLRERKVALPEHSATIGLKYACLYPSWYKRTFRIPADWQGREVWLHIGGVKPAVEIWVNGRSFGSTLTSRSPIRCRLTPIAKFGAQNTLALRLYWPPVRLDGMFDCMVAWSGLYRNVWIEAVPRMHIGEIHVDSSISPPAAKIQVSICGSKTAAKPLRVVCKVTEQHGAQKFHGCAELRSAGEGYRTDLPVAMPGARLWSPEAPTMYRADVLLFDGETLLDEAGCRFGLREIRTDGHKVLLNRKPIFLRGGCDDQLYPWTICPPADKAYFAEHIRKAKQYGFNYTKSCCEIFTAEFLNAADELGYLVCQEMPFGLRAKIRQTRLNPTPAFVRLWRGQLANIVKSCRNHPSVVAYSMTSELVVSEQSKSSFEIFQRELPATTRKLAPGALLFDSTSTAQLNHSCGIGRMTPFGKRNTDLIEELVPGQDPLCPLTGPIPGLEKVDLPFVLHEWDWITSLPNPKAAERYRGIPLKLIGVREMIAAARREGVRNQLDVFVECSRLLKHAFRKYCLELARRHPKIAGYHHWLIQDFMAHCPEGVFNEFWDEPRGLSAEEFRTYNDDTVLLLNDYDQRCFEYRGKIPLGVMVSHFGRLPLKRVTIQWRLCKDRTLLAEGHVPLDGVKCGALISRALDIRLPDHGPVGKMELRCEMSSGGRNVCWNRWNLWLVPKILGAELPPAVWTDKTFLAEAYPGIKPVKNAPKSSADCSVLVTGTMDDRVIDFLVAGGRVLLLSRGALREAEGTKYRTEPINYGTDGNMGTMMRAHPALGVFNGETWCDFAFALLINGIRPMDLSVFHPVRIDPIIRSIGHHLTFKDKAYLFEARVGQGRLLACSLKLEDQYATEPAARHLLDSMLRYVTGRTLLPASRVSVELLSAARPQTP